MTDIELSRALVERLKTIPLDEWIEIEHQFNSWIIPMRFYDLMPKWWLSNDEPMRRRFDLINAVCEVIDSKIPQKEQLQYHNVQKRSAMTVEEFEYWYSIRGIDDSYWTKRVFMESIHWWEDDVFNKIKEALE